MHFQFPPHAEMKLVNCVRGEVWDVAVDLRRGSPTFLKWFGVHLSAQNGQLMLNSGLTNLGTGASDTDTLDRTLQFNDKVTWLKGDHTLKIGGRSFSRDGMLSLYRSANYPLPRKNIIPGTR